MSEDAGEHEEQADSEPTAEGSSREGDSLGELGELGGSEGEEPTAETAENAEDGEATDPGPEAESEPIGLQFEALPAIKLVLGFALRFALATLIGLIALELALRALGLPEGSTRSMRAAYDIDDVAIGPFTPGSEVKIGWPEETAYEASFNSLGCRGPEPREVDAAPIVCLGDSLTFGLCVEDDETYPYYLDQLLAEAGEPRPVINLASGHLLIDDELVYLRGALPELKPSIVVLLMPGTGYVDPIDKMSQTVHQKSRRREKKRRRFPSNLYHQLAIYEARNFNRLWREHRQLIGVGAWPLDFQHATDTSFTVPLRERYVEKLRETKALVEQHGATLVLAAYPGTSFDAHHRLTITQPWSRAVAEELQTPYVDLHAAMSAEVDPLRLYLYPYDLHFSPRGNKVVARTVLETLRAHQLLER